MREWEGGRGMKGWSSLHDVLSVDTNSLIHLPIRSNKNCELRPAVC